MKEKIILSFTETDIREVFKDMRKEKALPPRILLTPRRAERVADYFLNMLSDKWYETMRYAIEAAVAEEGRGEVKKR